MTPKQFKEANVIFAKDQPEYQLKIMPWAAL